MSTNPSKYIKLSTQPWTGNGIQQPIQSLTFQDIPTNPATGSVTLTEAGNTLLVNGVEIAGSGSSAVLQIEAAPGSALVVSPTTGGVVLDVTGGGGGGVTSITGYSPLICTPASAPQANLTIACDPTGFVPSITTSSFDLSLSSSVGDITISTFSNITTPILTTTQGRPANNFSPIQINTNSLVTGVYLLEIIVNSSDAEDVRYGFNSLFRKYAGQAHLASQNLIHARNPAQQVKQCTAYIAGVVDTVLAIYLFNLSNTPNITITASVYRIL
jgi:hypothetical protein